jgi:hypothetical protein
MACTYMLAMSNILLLYVKHALVPHVEHTLAPTPDTCARLRRTFFTSIPNLSFIHRIRRKLELGGELTTSPASTQTLVVIPIWPALRGQIGIIVGPPLRAYKYSSLLRIQVSYSFLSTSSLCTCADLSVVAPAGTNSLYCRPPSTAKPLANDFTFWSRYDQKLKKNRELKRKTNYEEKRFLLRRF